MKKEIKKFFADLKPKVEVQLFPTNEQTHIDGINITINNFNSNTKKDAQLEEDEDNRCYDLEGYLVEDDD